MATAPIVQAVFRQMRMTLTMERYYPLAWAAAIALLCWWFDLKLPADPGRLLSATVTFGAIASGFVGTSLSILTGLGTPVMRKIRQSRYVDILRAYMGWALASGLVLSCTSIIGLFLSTTSLTLTIAWTATLTFCVACLYRLAKVMLFVFSDPENLLDG